MLNILSTIKITCIFLLLILVSFTSYSQTTEPAIAKVYYTLKHKRDTTNKDSVYIENMQLLTSSNISVFSSIDQIEQAERIEKNQDEQAKNWAGIGSPLFKPLSNARKTTLLEIYQFQKENKIMIKEYLFANYLYQEPLDTIKWELSSETKNFDKISCQKATATFKGRKWVAWFAPDIPFETGPWKLHGLPGLILNAYDDKKEVQYLFNGFESLTESKNNLKLYPITIELPKKAIPVSLEAINKLKASMYKDVRGFFNAQTAASRGIVDSRQLASFSFKKINNPIDLTENN